MHQTVALIGEERPRQHVEAERAARHRGADDLRALAELATVSEPLLEHSRRGEHPDPGSQARRVECIEVRHVAARAFAKRTAAGVGPPAEGQPRGASASTPTTGSLASFDSRGSSTRNALRRRPAPP